MADNVTSNGALPAGGPKVPPRPEVRTEPSKNPEAERKAEPTTTKAAASPLSGAASSDSAFVSASESEPESVEEEMVDDEAEAMDAEEEVVASPPKPKRSISDIDWTEAGFNPEPKRSRLAWIAVVALGALGLVLLFVLFLVPPSPDSARANQTAATQEVAPPEPPPKRGASNFPSPPASLPPARVKTPKSLNDLKVGNFVVNQRRSGDDLIIVSGDIENVSENVHRGIRVELDLLDAQGLKVSSTNHFMAELAPRATWHVLAPTSNARVASARLTGIKEDP